MRRINYLVIALISLTLIPLELSWTRIFSAEFFYAFAFLVLSLAILGLGLGGLALRLWQRLANLHLLGIYLALAGLCALLGPILVFKLQPDFSALFSSWLMVGKLALTVLILMSTYFFGGLALSLLFRENHADMPRLYMADLLGAGVGVLIAIWGMNQFGTPQASFLIALPILAASFVTSRDGLKVIPVLIAVLVFTFLPRADDLLRLEREERAPVIYTHWDAMSKIKVYQYDSEYRGINIDNVANTPVSYFDGNWADVKPESTSWPIDVSYLINRFDSCVFLSLGAGGGGDVLQALVEGATEIHAVEVNPHINWMMLVDDTAGYVAPPPPPPDSSKDTAQSAQVDTIAKPMMSIAEFSGGIYHDPRVRVVTEDARSYVRRHPGKFDVIYSLSSNSWAALASGAFALAENYLFTTDAYIDYWRAMSDSGFLMMEHQMYTPRLVAEVVDALTELDVAKPTEHFAVYDLPQMRRKILLLSKQPLTDSLRYYALGPLTAERFGEIHLIYPPANDSVANHLINKIIAQGWRRVADSAAIDISPVTDNRPFVAQLGKWKNLNAENLKKVSAYAEFTGFPLSKITMLIVSFVVLLIVLPINLIPYAVKGPHLRAAPWLYFFCIGVAFMGVEIILIQKYALLLGTSLYSMATVLLTLLIASGIGSRFADHFSDRAVFPAIVGWLCLEALAFGFLADVAGGQSLAFRSLLAVVLIAPVGFFMGMPFPKGALKVGALIDWGFAVNGAASVLGSVLILVLAFAWGFTIALLVAALFYLAAFVLIRTRLAW